MCAPSFSRQYWPGTDPVGKRLKWGVAEAPGDWLTVVGVIADVKQDSLDAPGAAQILVPLDQLEHSIPKSLRDDSAGSSWLPAQALLYLTMRK